MSKDELDRLLHLLESVDCDSCYYRAGHHGDCLATSVATTPCDVARQQLTLLRIDAE
jgi:hypothetical protein